MTEPSRGHRKRSPRWPVAVAAAAALFLGACSADDGTTDDLGPEPSASSTWPPGAFTFADGICTQLDWAAAYGRFGTIELGSYEEGSYQPSWQPPGIACRRELHGPDGAYLGQVVLDITLDSPEANRNATAPNGRWVAVEQSLWEQCSKDDGPNGINLACYSDNMRVGLKTAVPAKQRDAGYQEAMLALLQEVHDLARP